MVLIDKLSIIKKKSKLTEAAVLDIEGINFLKQ